MNHLGIINPLVLKWARETAGLSIEQVVRKLSRKRITVETILSWETGESAPDYIQLERLAYEVYKRPLALFFFPEVPTEGTPREDFRTLPNSELDELPQRMRFLIRQAKVMQINLEELCGGGNPASRQIVRDLPFDTSLPVAELARSARQFLNIPIETQLGWKTNEQAFKVWRSTLEEHGVFVFKDAFKSDSISGFCLYDELFPVIYVNNSRAITHQIFTLFHELAHLLSGTGGIDGPTEKYIGQLRGRNKQIEVLCSQFAGVFLVPDEYLGDRINKLSIDEDRIKEFAGEYKVSPEVILRRLLDKNLVTPDYYGELVAKWRRMKPKRRDGGDYYRTKGVYLGERYLELVFSRFYHREISIDQAADYLGVKVSFVPNMEGLLIPKDLVA